MSPTSSRPPRRSSQVAVAALGLAVVLAGCGATRTLTETTTVTTTQTVTSAARTSRNRSSAPAAKPVAATSSTSGSSTTPAAAPASSSGSTLTVHDFSGDALGVQAHGLVDPATPANPDFGSAAGSRLVAIELTLTSSGPGTISSDANSNLSVQGSDGQVYTASFDEVSECTNFNHGEYTLLNGGSVRGCVVFQLPNGVKVSSAQFTLGRDTVQFNNG